MRRKCEIMTLMVCYDDSPASQAALALAAERAALLKAKLLIVRSMQTAPEVTLDDIRAVEATLYEKEDFIKEQGIPCEAHLLTRGLEPGEDITEFARERSVDEIVIGVRKRSRLEKLILGSTAQFVILHATCPVITTKPVASSPFRAQSEQASVT